MNKPIVLLISAKAQHGKDSFAEAFTKEAQDRLGFRCLTIKYGDILKYVGREYFGWDGKKMCLSIGDPENKIAIFHAESIDSMNSIVIPRLTNVIYSCFDD